MPLRLVLALVALIAGTLAGALAAQAGGERPEARAAAGGATAQARAYARRDASGGERGAVAVTGDGERSGAGTHVRASTAGGRGVAEARASTGGVELFDGLVRAASVQATARAARGSVSLGGSVSGLVVNGRSIGTPPAGSSYDMDGYGTLVVLTAADGGIVGLRARLTKAYGRYEAGSQATVAFAQASATDGAREPRTTPRREPPRERPRPRPSGGERRSSGEDRPARRPRRAAPRRRRAPELRALETGGGYAFPVHGREATFSNDWGAPRQHTGTHAGTDVFAPAGTPVLAVTSGTLYRVGTRAVPGNRLWLRGRGGDTFFYAHLSAFAHDARNGARVRAGDVIGFVGSTGDAERTPPHLHFEIHPDDGDAVNPYPFLLAWRERRDVPQAAWLARYGNDPGSRPGALVVVDDFLSGG